jgi:hypothetical protein
VCSHIPDPNPHALTEQGERGGGGRGGGGRGRWGGRWRGRCASHRLDGSTGVEAAAEIEVGGELRQLISIVEDPVLEGLGVPGVAGSLHAGCRDRRGVEHQIR